MYDKELVVQILNQIFNASLTVMSRFELVSDVSDFSDSPSGMEKMDSLCMQLIVIGEAIKKLDKITEDRLLPQYPDVDWRKAKGMRDILTHHYADVDPHAVFFTCSDKIPVLHKTIGKIIEDIS
ncbi:MAG: HepT-like ribonuclease domain-containing protein [Desulfomonilaceae bacterium]|jgi:uncharacterized protein with HEPN domain